MNYSPPLDFDMGFLPGDFWDYNPAWDVHPEEKEGLDLEGEVWYNGSSEDKEEERKSV